MCIGTFCTERVSGPRYEHTCLHADKTYLLPIMGNFHNKDVCCQKN